MLRVMKRLDNSIFSRISGMLMLPAVALVSIVLLPGCIGGNSSQDAAGGSWQSVTGEIWKTAYNVEYQGDSVLKDSIVSILDQVGHALSIFDSTSLVSQVNRQDTTPVNTDFIKAYITAKRVHRLTDGAFDPTLAPLIAAWGFGPGHTQASDTLRIDSIMQFVGIGRSKLYRDMLIKEDPRLEFNFSGIAKGYGADRVAEMLRRHGVENYMVEVGGETYAEGRNRSDNPWRVAIPHDSIISLPAGDSTIMLNQRGIATAGLKTRLYKSNGSIMSRIISPQTGRPVITDMLSATVVSKTAAEADALSTAMIAIGSEKARKLSERLDLPVLFVLADSSVYISDKMKDLITEE